MLELQRALEVHRAEGFRAFAESHQPSGLGWFKMPHLLTTLSVSTLWGGVYPSPYPCLENLPFT